MNPKKKVNSEFLLFKKYNLIKNIGDGAFGTVFLGTNVWTDEKVAIKIEERKKPRPTLEREANILYYLKGPGLPELISFGKTKNYNILVQTLLGKSLFQLFNESKNSLCLKHKSAYPKSAITKTIVCELMRSIKIFGGTMPDS